MASTTQFYLDEIIWMANKSARLNSAQIQIDEYGKNTKYTYVKIQPKKTGSSYTLTIKNGKKFQAAIYPDTVEAYEDREAAKFQTTLPKLHKEISEIYHDDMTFIEHGMMDENGNWSH
jgi:hypothetical protein